MNFVINTTMKLDKISFSSCGYIVSFMVASRVHAWKFTSKIPTLNEGDLLFNASRCYDFRLHFPPIVCEVDFPKIYNLSLGQIFKSSGFYHEWQRKSAESGEERGQDGSGMICFG